MNFLQRFVRGLKTGLSAISPNCREASRLQSDTLEQALPLARRVGLRIHLLLCRWCRRYGEQLRFLRHAVREHPEQVNAASPHSLSPEARERLKQALRNEPK